MNFLWVALGASLGASARYGLYLFCSRLPTAFNIGTIVANLLGCFIIGSLIPVMGSWPAPLKLSLVTGFLGALTTFSTFSLEINPLLELKQLLAAGITLVVSVLGGLILCGAGTWMTRYFLSGESY